MFYLREDRKPRLFPACATVHLLYTLRSRYIFSAKSLDSAPTRSSQYVVSLLFSSYIALAATLAAASPTPTDSSPLARRTTCVSSSPTSYSLQLTQVPYPATAASAQSTHNKAVPDHAATSFQTLHSSSPSPTSGSSGSPLDLTTAARSKSPIRGVIRVPVVRGTL